MEKKLLGYISDCDFGDVPWYQSQNTTRLSRVCRIFLTFNELNQNK